MKRLLIMGAGGCGREVMQLAMDINNLEHRWDSFFFLDYDAHILEGKNCEAKIIANDDTYNIRENDEFSCAVGDSALRRKIIKRMEAKGAQFISLIHPTAQIAKSAELGESIIIYPYCIVTADSKIGKGCVINAHTSIAHDVVVGEYCTISPNCHIAGGCMIGDNVFMGIGVNIIPSVKIEKDSYICAGSTIMTRVKEGSKMFGCPAKKIRNW